MVVPCTQEARGLDAGPRLVEKLRSVADPRSAAIVHRISTEELAHVAVGAPPETPSMLFAWATLHGISVWRVPGLMPKEVQIGKLRWLRGPGEGVQSLLTGCWG